MENAKLAFGRLGFLKIMEIWLEDGDIAVLQITYTLYPLIYSYEQFLAFHPIGKPVSRSVNTGYLL